MLEILSSFINIEENPLDRILCYRVYVYLLVANQEILLFETMETMTVPGIYIYKNMDWKVP